MLDGWTDDSSNHYIALFAIYWCPTRKKVCRPLLAIAPLLDPTHYTAEKHAEYVTYILHLYGKSMSNVICFVGDNCETNQSMAGILGSYLIECASYKLNLAVQKYLQDYEPLLNKVHVLMSKLGTLKQRAKLRQKTQLSPVTRNTTRWPSTMSMVRRYLRLKIHIDADDAAIAVLLPTAAENNQLNALMNHLSCTLKLQEENITLKTSRDLFDRLITDYPAMSHHLAVDANIVHTKEFDSAVLKVLNNKESELSELEKTVISDLENIDADPVILENNNEQLSYAELALRDAREQPQTTSNYIDLNFLPTTSILVERLFSAAKFVLTDCRKSMYPVHFEASLFLKVNRELWSVETLNCMLQTVDEDMDILEEQQDTFLQETYEFIEE